MMRTQKGKTQERDYYTVILERRQEKEIKHTSQLGFSQRKKE